MRLGKEGLRKSKDLARKSKDAFFDYTRSAGDKLRDSVSRAVSGGDSISDLQQRLSQMTSQRDYLVRMSSSILNLSGSETPASGAAGSSVEHGADTAASAVVGDALRSRLDARKASSAFRPIDITKSELDDA